MHCCVCSQVCGHIGGPYYCAVHTPNPNVINTYPWQPAPIYSVPGISKCEHCYCKEINDYDGEGVSHKKCCNCGNRQRIAAGKREEKEK